MATYALANRLLSWYRVNGRDLPWRRRHGAYAIWVSEIMLQQTRVETVVPYYLRWMERFPNLAALATASEHEVLKAWEGLGYYSRARNMRRTARLIMEQFGGRMPRDAASLRLLPGIGRYTAGAIASIAFGRDEPAMDANIRRVLARVFNVEEPADSPAGVQRLWGLAEANLPRGHAGDFNQALMDLGATICVPARPRCEVCPLRGLCQARRLGVQQERPVLTRKTAGPHYTAVAAVIVRHGRVLLSRRPSSGLLGGMWEFPNARVSSPTPRKAAAALGALLGFDLSLEEPVAVIHHGYSHFSVDVHAFRCAASTVHKREGLRWVPIPKLGDYAMGKIDRQIARKLA